MHFVNREKRAEFYLHSSASNFDFTEVVEFKLEIPEELAGLQPVIVEIVDYLNEALSPIMMRILDNEDVTDSMFNFYIQGHELIMEQFSDTYTSKQADLIMKQVFELWVQSYQKAMGHYFSISLINNPYLVVFYKKQLHRIETGFRKQLPSSEVIYLIAQAQLKEHEANPCLACKHTIYEFLTISEKMVEYFQKTHPEYQDAEYHQRLQTTIDFTQNHLTSPNLVN